jgi:hypothetical protein
LKKEENGSGSRSHREIIKIGRRYYVKWRQNFIWRDSKSSINNVIHGLISIQSIGTAGLGVWQSKRYFQKAELIAENNKKLLENPKNISGFSPQEYVFPIIPSSSGVILSIFVCL